jgi:hypothetical protein
LMFWAVVYVEHVEASVEWWKHIGLPPGYWLEHDADLMVLRRPDGGPTAVFNVRGIDPVEVAAAAWEDAE